MIPALTTGIFAKKQNQVIFITALLTIIIIYILSNKDDEKPPKSGFLPLDVGGALPPNWNPNPVASDLFRVIDGIFESYEDEIEAYTKFNVLNDNQIIAVYNYWGEEYANKNADNFKKFGTLTQAIKNEWQVPEAGTKALIRLQRLGLP